MPRIEAVIFDMDGVLVDSEPVHRAASRQLVAPHEMTDEQYEQFIGASGTAFMTWVQSHYDLDATIEELNVRYSAHILEELRAHPLQPLDGVVDLIAALSQKGVLLGVASQSQPEWVRATLEGAKLHWAFQAIVAGDAVSFGKPYPDIYLHTATQLGVPAGACLAIEDSVPGVAAAAAAGMVVVQSRQGSLPALPQPEAHHVVDSLRAFDLEWLGGGPSTTR
ncbi:MAG: HAD family phosphatase [Chloroflexi bacterium]|nr:MAG: HAD family phosphatase [Chloroflexota bacterium]